jgi:diketogulonate reductase-like aldo/keto reductase
MEDVFDSGLAKAIGVSNFNADQLKRIVESARIAPHNNQVVAE